MIKRFKKKTEDTEDINSWVFEQDIKQLFMAGYDKKTKRMLLVVNVCLALIVLALFSVYLYHCKSILETIRAVLCPIVVGVCVAQLLLQALSWLWKWRVVRQYWPIVVIPVLALAITIIFIKMYPNNGEPLHRADILGFIGDFLAFLGAFCLGYFIYVKDCEKRIEEKRSKVRLLIVQIESANAELLRLNQLYRYIKRKQLSADQIVIEPISFDSNWLIYYLEYESLKGSNLDLKSTVSAFFDNITRINVAIKIGKMESAIKINEQYIDCLMYSTQKYSELEAIICLNDACDDYKFYNTKSWLEREETVDLINELCKKILSFN